MIRIQNLDKMIGLGQSGENILLIDEFVSELCEHGDNLMVLTEPQKNFFYNQLLEKEINNGGFDQYFFNAGEFAHETVNSLKIIGAVRTAGILQRAINEFPDGHIPIDAETRLVVLKNLGESAQYIWEALDQDFYEYNDDLNFLNLNYIKENMSFF